MKDTNSKLSTQNLNCTLVIGYGNQLRGDDAIGPLAAQAVAGWAIPHVRALAVHQLVPELAADLAQADLAVFVDAYAATQDAPIVGVHEVDLAPLRSLVWHTGDPGPLLALAYTVYGYAPRAWWVTVPASRFEYGAKPTQIAQSGLAEALEAIRQLLGSDDLNLPHRLWKLSEH